MPLQITAAPSSARRVSKPRPKNPLLQRSASSPFGSHPRRKTSSPSGSRKVPSKSRQTASELSDGDDNTAARLPDKGLVAPLAREQKLRDVAQILRYANEHMFDEIPERAPGMNSTRISEVLRFRRRLPPIVSVAHVHALSRSATVADRETAELVRKGVVRRLRVPDRGMGRSALGDSLVLVEKWVQTVEACDALPEETRQMYVAAMKEHPDVASVPVTVFRPAQASQLIKEGFLTSASNAALASSNTRPDSATLGSLVSLSSAGSRAAAGSMAAVGGSDALHSAGGGGTAWSSTPSQAVSQLALTLPSVGIYLRLLASARDQLVALLAKSKYREAPLDLLRERWDGAVSPTSGTGARRSSGYAGVVLPGQTKRWKQFYGLRFQWILEECLGTGVIEVFDTGSVGLGVRLT